VESNRNPGIFWIALALAFATALAYWPVLSNDFVNYDDDLYILNNPYVQRGLGSDTIVWAFTTFRGANWFPLTWLSWAGDFSLYGENAAGFHATSLLLHITNTVLLFVVFARMTGARWCSAFVAAVFALHPLHVESVAWAAARKDVLSGFFAMLALIAYERHVRRAGRALVWVGAFLVLGLMAKPTLVTWPFVLLLLDEWPLRRLRDRVDPQHWDRTRVRHAVVEKLPLFAVVVVISGIAIASQSHWGTVQGLDRFPLSMRVANAITSYTAYLADVFRPLGLAVFYPHPGPALGAGRVMGSAALLVGVTAAALAVRRRFPEFAVGWFWFVGMLVPVIGLVQVGQAARADRYTYLPLIGLCLPIAFALAGIARRGRGWRTGVAGLSLAVLFALGIGTHRQVERWRDSETLFTHALSVTKRNHVAHINLGVVRLAEGEHERAARHLTRALQLAPASATAAGLLGDARLAQARAEAALKWYHRALEVEPKSLRWREGVANAELDLGRIDAAIRGYRSALAVVPNSARLHGNLGFALIRAERYEAAAASLNAALAIKPDLAEVRGNLGVALLEAGDHDGALAAFERALEQNPDLALIQAHAGNLRSKRGEFEPAIEHLANAVRIEPGNPAFRVAYARGLARAGYDEAALAEYRRSLAQGERSLPVLVGLAQLEIAAGNAPQAIALAEEAVSVTRREVPAVLALLGEGYALARRMSDAARVTDEAAGVARAGGAAGVAAELKRRAEAYRTRVPR
jgi:tetratricopeptide (TPR) repeat protein